MKIAIVSSVQYGYHTDYYKIYKEAKAEYSDNVLFFCPTQNKEKIDAHDENIIYLSNLPLRMQLKKLDGLLMRYKFNLVWLSYFKGCSKITKKDNIVVDIRTASTSSNPLKRMFNNLIMLIELKRFNKVSILSHSLAREFRIKKYYYIPLGADISKCIECSPKRQLLYIGIIRDGLHEMVKGYNKYVKENKNPPDLVIVGYGKKKIVKIMLEEIEKCEIKNKIKFLGFIKHDDLQVIIKESMVGLSFIPQKKYFDFQPPTKTFEYLLSGIPCIATNTYENKRIINYINGELCDDNADSFYLALCKTMKRVTEFNSDAIIRSVELNSWSNIYKYNFKRIIVEHE